MHCKLHYVLVRINSLNIVQFVVRMRSNKNCKMRHCRKKFCGLEGFSLNPWIFKILTHGYCFYFSTALTKFPDKLINLAQYHVHNNLSLLGCQLHVFLMGRATGRGTFFHARRFQNRSFFEVPDSVFKKTEIYDLILSFNTQF